MNRALTLGAGAALLAGLIAAVLLWSRPPEPPPAPLVAQPLLSVPAVAPPAASAPSPVAASEPAPDPTVLLPPLVQADPTVKDKLIELLGRKPVISLLQTDGFVRRFVVTVDNLPRGHAAARVWPVNPTPDRFTVERGGRVAADNAARYGPFVHFIEGIEPAAAAALYRRLYPLLQEAYAELGYPNQRFHGRLIEVIDHLLATPLVPGPLGVTLTTVKGPIPAQRPWVRYEFSDPRLQELSAGQKMLLRSGEANQRLLLGWLRRLRAEIVR